MVCVTRALERYTLQTRLEDSRPLKPAKSHVQTVWSAKVSRTLKPDGAASSARRAQRLNGRAELYL